MDRSFLSRFIKGVISTSTGTFTQMFLGFIGLMIAVRYVSREDFGIFVLIQVIAQLFVVLSSVALENISVTKFIASVEVKKKVEVANAVICFKLLIGLIMCLVIFLCKPLISYVFKYEKLSQVLIYIPLFFILNAFYEFFMNVLQGFHKYKKMAISQVINGVVKLLFVILFLIVLKKDLSGLIFAFLLAFAVAIVFQYSVLPVKRRFSFDLRIFKEIFKFGIPLGLNNILTFIYARVDRFLLGAMIGPIGVAYYDVASRIPINSSRMFESFRSVFFPNMSELIAKKRYAEAERVLNNSLRIVSFVTFFAALVATLFQIEIVRLLFSARYLDCAPALSLLMLSLSISIIGNIIGTSLVALGQPDKPVKVVFIDTVVNVIANIIMIPVFGFMGAAYASLLARSVATPFVVWFMKRGGIGIKISQFLKPLLAFGVLGILYLLIKPESLIIKISFVIFFLVSCLALSIIKKKDFLALFEGLKPSV
jgi:O-antigen/teichoic acid export membrane protein